MECNKTLIVKATTACNLNCPYCYNYKNSHYREDISEETINQILKVFKDNIGSFVWHGGEPLLVGEKFFRETNQKIKEINPFTQINIQTNATLINQEFVEIFKKYNMFIGISFDGIHNNKTRKNNEKLFEIFSYLKEEDVKFGCLHVFSDSSQSSLIEEYEFAKKNQLEINTNTIFKARGNDASYNLDKERIVGETCEFFDYWMYDTNNPISSPYLKKYINALLGSRYHVCENTFCVGSWFSVSPNGDIYPCGRDWNKDYCFCNIHEIKCVEDIYKTANYKKFYNISKQLTAQCIEKKCPFFTMCSGGCYARHINWIEESGKIEVEPQFCYAQKRIFSYLFNKINDIGLNDYEKYNPFFIELLMKNRYINIKDIINTL